tara:strand:+ start:29 stop:214 length:186 start_codon:yes stop_codon:yes gene_type:complete
MAKKNQVYEFLADLVRKIIEDELSQEHPNPEQILEDIEMSAQVYHDMEDYLGKRIDFMGIS